MRSHRKFTPSTIVQIPRWLDEGLSADQIAARIGCTVGTLKVKCSKLGISLRRRKPNYDRANENVNGTRRARKRSSEPREPLNLRVRPGTLDRLRTYASSKGYQRQDLQRCFWRRSRRMICTRPFLTTTRYGSRRSTNLPIARIVGARAATVLVGQAVIKAQALFH